MKVIENYRIVPTKGGGVCLVGTVDGAEIQTSDIVFGRRGAVKTESGSVYQLGAPSTTMWEMQLQLRRPEKYKKLAEAGVFG